MNDASDRDEHERERRRLERILPELIKRALETGYEKLTEGPESVRQFVSELKLPKDALALLLAQVDETKHGLYRAVAREVRDFLDKTNLSEELVKALTGVAFEIRTEIRFVPNDARPGTRPKADVQSKVSLRRSPSAPPPAETAGARDTGDAARPTRASAPPEGDTDDSAAARRSSPPSAGERPDGGMPDRDHEEKVE